VLMFAFFPIAVFYVQQELNKVWEAETEAGATPAEPASEQPPA
jgi:hypothetical protein